MIDLSAITRTLSPCWALPPKEIHPDDQRRRAVAWGIRVPRHKTQCMLPCARPPAWRACSASSKARQRRPRIAAIEFEPSAQPQSSITCIAAASHAACRADGLSNARASMASGAPRPQTTPRPLNRPKYFPNTWFGIKPVLMLPLRWQPWRIPGGLIHARWPG